MIVIDPGHGGVDSGAVGNGIVEKEINLNISRYIYDRLRELGIPVKMTRSSDETLPPAQRVSRILNAFGDNSNVIVVSNHVNAGGGEGAEVIYALRNNDTLASSVLQELAKSGQKIRKVYQRTLPTDPSKDYYFIHRETGRTQPIIVEYGFVDNKNDASRLKANYKNYAEAVVKALVEYLGKPYTPPGISSDVYTVKPGDSLWSISKMFNLSVEELKAANNLTNNLLSVGQVLKIPTRDVPKAGEYIVYTVKPNDTLYSIAKAYGITPEELISYNNLGGTLLSIGQQLLIPSKKEETPINQNGGVIHKVQEGDTLYSISRRYNVDMDEIMAINGLGSTILTLGQELIIPVENSNENSYGDLPVDNNYIEYSVQPGDTLYSIAKRYEVNINDLMSYNNLSNTILRIGQIIRIPTKGLPITYIVRSGDTLYSIARQYNTTVDAIKSKNNLTSDVLTVGSILVI